MTIASLIKLSNALNINLGVSLLPETAFPSPIIDIDLSQFQNAYSDLVKEGKKSILESTSSEYVNTARAINNSIEDENTFEFPRAV